MKLTNQTSWQRFPSVHRGFDDVSAAVFEEPAIIIVFNFENQLDVSCVTVTAL